MGILAKIRQYLTKAINPATGAQNSGPRNTPGGPVSNERALRLSAVYACVQILVRTVPTLPIHVYRRLPSGGKALDATHWLNRVLRHTAGGDMSSLWFRQYLELCVATRGNGYAKILRDAKGVPHSLIALDATRVRPFVLDSGQLVYEYRDSRGTLIQLNKRDVFHLKGWGDQFVGYSPIEFGATIMGLALKQDEIAKRHNDRNAIPEGVITSEGKFMKGQRQDFVDQLNAAQKEEGFWILEGGMTFAPISITPKDAQLIESREFSIQDIGRFFGVPSHLINDGSNAAQGVSGIESLTTIFAVFNVAPRCAMWEDAIRTQLLSEAESEVIVVEHQTAGLLRADAAGRATIYNSGMATGWLVANDVRRLENLEPVDGGDELRAPMNTTPVSGWWLTLNEVRIQNGLPPIKGGDIPVSKLQLDFTNGSGPSQNTPL